MLPKAINGGSHPKERMKEGDGYEKERFSLDAETPSFRIYRR